MDIQVCSRDLAARLDILGMGVTLFSPNDLNNLQSNPEAQKLYDSVVKKLN